MPFITLTEDEEKELWRLNRFYWKEAERCEEAKAYLAGCVMLGSSLETILILIISLYDTDVERTGRVPHRDGKPKPLLKWDLAELISVAKAAGWLPSGLKLDENWDSRKARVGDYAEVARMMRNLTHPARYLKQHPRRRVTKRYLQRQFEIVLACRDWLAAHNNRELPKRKRNNYDPLPSSAPVVGALEGSHGAAQPRTLSPTPPRFSSTPYFRVIPHSTPLLRQQTWHSSYANLIF